MSFREKQMDIPWRRVYEAEAAVGWTGSGVLMGGMALFTSLPAGPFYVLGGVSVVFALKRWAQSFRIWDIKFALAGRGIWWMKSSNLQKSVAKHKNTELWLGRGFDWTREHSQRMYDLQRYQLSDFMPPDWFMRLRGVVIDQQSKKSRGAPWIHGLEPKEKELTMPIADTRGHTLIIGTTGAGKTRLFELMIAQAVQRGDIVIILDPKGDKEMKARAAYSCQVTEGREEAFRYFHPAFPEESVRIDPLKNWSKHTEIASRIAALMPAENPNDPFVQFAWRAINLIVQGLCETDSAPNIAKLRKYIEGGPEALLERVLARYLKRTFPGDWEARVAPFLKAVQDGKIKRKSEYASAELIAYVSFFKQECAEEHPDEVCEGMISMFDHSREHFGKMIASLIPLLDMLSTGAVGKLISPDPDDIEDPREIMDSQKIIRGNHCIYIALDSMPDSVVASAIGSIFLADLVAVAGSIYNYGGVARKNISLFVDEANEIANDPFLSLLNKARGAGFTLSVATQTLSDFTDRFGSEAKTFKALGNFNNLISLRIEDEQTKEFVVNKFGETWIESLQYSLNTTNDTDKSVTHFSGSEGVRSGEQRMPMIPGEIMSKLPDLQYFAHVSGGRIIKGRIPMLKNDVLMP